MATLIAMSFLHDAIWHLVVAKVLVALASGVCVTAVVVRTATSAEHGDTGIATSLVLVTRVIGFAAGTQISGAFLTAGTPAGSEIPAESAFTIGFLIAGAITALALLAVRAMGKGVKE
jgi:predicted MFS family arabinose efflux permease